MPTPEVQVKIVATLVANGWDRVIESWWRSYNQNRTIDQAHLDHITGAYLVLVAGDIAEALEAAA